jgi:hypothetical protein
MEHQPINGILFQSEIGKKRQNYYCIKLNIFVTFIQHSMTEMTHFFHKAY